MSNQETVIAFIVGPTGVGKTEIAIILAQSIRAEILNVDSRQIYRLLEIGTAKPTHEERRRVRHHLIDFQDPSERCSAGRFASMFADAAREIASRGVRAYAVGGAGLYVDACLGRLHPLPPASEEIRAELDGRIRTEGLSSLHRDLTEIDPVSAARISANDERRIVRALEVHRLTGKPLSACHSGPALAICPPETPVVYLTRERRELYRRIEARCDAMIAAGLPGEVRVLIERGARPGSPGLSSVGYAEWARWVCGEIDYEGARELFVRNSRRYAKRQETWFRNRHPDRVDVSIPASEPAEVTARRIHRVLGL